MRQVRSIAFHAMDETEFSALLGRAIDLVTTKLIPGLGSEDLMDEINEMVG